LTAGLDHIFSTIGSLTPAQQSVLGAVSKHENPVTVADLAEECGLHVNTVREPLGVLRSLGLVEREGMPASGRGRPAWGYLSRALSGVASSVDMLHHIARSTISWIRATAPDPMAAGRELGHYLGDDALATASVPDHEAIDFPADFKLANHMTKIRVLLIAYGLAAEAHPEIPTALVLRDSPFAEGDDPDPVAFAIRRGMVERIIERTARGTATPTFRSGPDPRVCEVILVPTGTIRPQSEPVS
jgi:predicted transcriptional regulator